MKAARELIPEEAGRSVIRSDEVCASTREWTYHLRLT